MPIDTFKIRLPITSENRKNIDALIRKASNGKTTQYWETGNYNDLGKVCSLDFGAGNKNFYLSGSLPKFYLGNNVKAMSPKEINDAFQQLENELGFSIGHANITKIHIAHTLEMDYEPQLYFNYLGECPSKYRSNFTSSTLYYTGKSKWKNLCLYDKGKEIAKDLKNKSVCDKNLLRLELRLEESIHKLLKMKRHLLVKDLYDPATIKLLNKIWVEELNSIHRCIPILNVKELVDAKSPKDVIGCMFVSLLKEKLSESPDYLEQMHMLVKKSNCFSKATHNYRMLRKTVEGLIEKHGQVDRWELEEELSSKINTVLTL